MQIPIVSYPNTPDRQRNNESTVREISPIGNVCFSTVVVRPDAPLAQPWRSSCADGAASGMGVCRRRVRIDHLLRPKGPQSLRGRSPGMAMARPQRVRRQKACSRRLDPALYYQAIPDRTVSQIARAWTPVRQTVPVECLLVPSCQSPRQHDRTYSSRNPLRRKALRLHA